MPTFSRTSTAKLDTCHADLITIFNEVIKTRDCTIVEGHRGEEEQNAHYYAVPRESWAKFPDSKHNSLPSKAADVMEYHPEKPHLHWEDKDGMEDFAIFVLATAERLFEEGRIAHKLRWGADWDQDGIRVDKDQDESFFDGPHFELVEVA